MCEFCEIFTAKQKIENAKKYGMCLEKHSDNDFSLAVDTDEGVYDGITVYYCPLCGRLLRKNDIKVGDVVKFVNADSTLGVVTAVNNGYHAFVLECSGFQGYYPFGSLEKVGRHIDAEGFLKQINPEDQFRR